MLILYQGALTCLRLFHLVSGGQGCPLSPLSVKLPAPTGSFTDFMG
jgi:hypothetical protein